MHIIQIHNQYCAVPKGPQFRRQVAKHQDRVPLPQCSLPGSLYVRGGVGQLESGKAWIGIYVSVYAYCIFAYTLSMTSPTYAKHAWKVLKWALLRTSLLFGKVIQTESIVFAAGFQLLIKHAHVTRPLLAVCAGWLGKDLWCARALHWQHHL